MIRTERTSMRSRRSASLIGLFRPGPPSNNRASGAAAVFCRRDFRRRAKGGCRKSALANISSNAADNSPASRPRTARPKSRQPAVTPSP